MRSRLKRNWMTSCEVSLPRPKNARAGQGVPANSARKFQHRDRCHIGLLLPGSFPVSVQCFGRKLNQYRHRCVLYRHANSVEEKLALYRFVVIEFPVVVSVAIVWPQS